MTGNIKDLRGVGDKTARLFEKLGIFSVDDLLMYYPRGYQMYTAPVQVREVREGEINTVKVQIVSDLRMNKKGNLTITSVTGADSSGRLTFIWFRAPYLKSILRRGYLFCFRGKVVRRGGRLQMEQAEVFTPGAYGEVENSLRPVYALTAGITSRGIGKLVAQVLTERKMELEYLPWHIRERYHLPEANYAVETIHFPKTREDLSEAHRRLAFDEFLLFILAVRTLREKTIGQENHFPMHPVWETEEIIESLPYTLTKAQQNVWRQIERDLCGHALMSRLVQGDVGSGKTILAFLAMVLTAENGYQTVLMAPTEVLAVQHFEGMKTLLKENQLDYGLCLLTGSTSQKDKKDIYQRLREGTCRVVIGTHALIQDKVEYKKLGLVITDEQHRFGVRQRESLTARGDVPHVLVMSATPIPRTLAIILYGDLSISILDELPAHRKPIKNCVVNTAWRPNAYRFIQKQVEEGRQVYIICPMVEESDELEAENVTDYTLTLKEALPDSFIIESLHGKMKAKDKNRIMEEFGKGKINILVSTTVIEVGVNVPNATVMMVENSERFGLAQLHQLRGRVGRGDHQSYCIFIQGTEDPDTRKRLDILNHSNDGFYIAEQDLKMRGPGDLFGVRQSGLLEFSIGDIYQDSDVLKLAGEAAAEILSLDPDLTLPQHMVLKRKLDHYMKDHLENLGI